MSARRYDLLIFDWDGTVSDSAAQIVEALRAAARAQGLEAPPATRMRSMIGLPLTRFALELHGLRGRAAERFVDSYRDAWKASGPSGGTPLFAGARKALEQLQGEGYLLAVATGKSRRGLDASLEACGLAPVFALTRTADETAPKPHPLMVHELLVDADCDPVRALVVGDTTYDVEMARAARVAAVAVTCGNHSVEALRAALPLAILDDVAALPTWLAA